MNAASIAPIGEVERWASRPAPGLADLPPLKSPRLLDGTGMRITEGLRLRVKDVDFSHGAFIV